MRQVFYVFTFLVLGLFYNQGHAQSLSQIKPSNGQVLNSTEVFLEWNKRQDASTYTLEVAYDQLFDNLLSSTNTAATSTILTVPHGHYYWRVIEGGESSDENYEFDVFLPSTFGDNVGVWVDFDSTSLVGNDIDTLYDTFNETKFVQSTGFRRPELITGDPIWNGQTYANFDGNDYLQFDTMVYSEDGYHVFAVAQSLSSDNNLRFICDQGFLASRGTGLIKAFNRVSVYGPSSFGSGFLHNTDVIYDDEHSIVHQLADFSDSMRILVNNSVIASAELGTAQFDDITLNNVYPFRIGIQAKIEDNTRAFIGNIGEIIVLKDTLLTPLEYTIINTYLNHKYAPPVCLGKDTIVNYGFCDSIDFVVPGVFLLYDWSNGDTSSAIRVRPDGLYSVTATDIFGTESTDDVLISPFTIFPKTQQFICEGDSVVLSYGIGEHYQFLWSNSSPDSSIVVTLPGDYYCTITDTNGCSITTDTINVEVDFFASSGGLGPDTSVCLGAPFEITSTQLIDSILWSTGGTSPIISIDSAGTYSTYAENINGCVLRDTVVLEISGTAPVVDFVTSNLCSGSEIDFTDLSNVFPPSTINQWIWEFGNNDSSTIQSPNYIFPSAGNYPVTLTAITDSSCFSSVTKNLVVAASPVASMTYDVICQNNLIQFADNSTGNIDTWLWEHPSQSSVLQNPVFSFATIGLDSISLVVTDVSGCIDSIVQPVEVFPPLIADFSFENTCLGETVQFTDETGSLSISNWVWSFGEPNAFSLQQNPQYIYSTTDTFEVQLQVENAIGCQSMIVREIIVNAAPNVSFDVTENCLGDETQFINTSTLSGGDTISSFEWTIDGSTFSGPNASYLFDDLGAQSVNLSLLTSSGCASDVSQNLEIYPVPTADFDFTPNFVSTPATIQFNNNSSGVINTYSWDFGDFSMGSTEINPSHLYSADGVYTVQLLAINEFDCADAIQKTVSLIQTELDIEVSDLSVQQITQTDGSKQLRVSVLLKNVGSRPITTANLAMQLNEEPSVSETWNGLLLVGGISSYAFTANYNLSTGLDQKYICVKATNVNDNSEQNLSNNVDCIVLSGAFQVSSPYPNPASNQVNINIISKSSGLARYRIISVDGKVLGESDALIINKGSNEVAINTSKIFSGKYWIDIEFLNEEFILPIVIYNK